MAWFIDWASLQPAPGTAFCCSIMGHLSHWVSDSEPNSNKQQCNTKWRKTLSGLENSSRRLIQFSLHTTLWIANVISLRLIISSLLSQPAPPLLILKLQKMDRTGPGTEVDSLTISSETHVEIVYTNILPARQFAHPSIPWTTPDSEKTIHDFIIWNQLNQKPMWNGHFAHLVQWPVTPMDQRENKID